MRHRRALMIGCAAVVALVIAPAAGACSIDSLGFNMPAGGVVHEGDSVTITMNVKADGADPNERDAPYDVLLDGKIVSSGTATAVSDGGQWTLSVPAQVSGTTDHALSLVAHLYDAAGAQTVTYNGPAVEYKVTSAPATDAAQQPAPSNAGPSPQSSPGASPPQRNAAVDAPRAPRPTSPPSAVGPSHVLQQAAPAAHHSAPAVATPPIVIGQREPVAVPTQVFVAHRRATPRHSAQVRTAVTAGRRVVDAPAVVSVRAPVQASEVVRAVPAIVAFAILLLLGVGGAAARVLRRLLPKTDGDPAALVHDLAIEAELQELIAEHHARSGAGRDEASKATNSA